MGLAHRGVILVDHLDQLCETSFAAIASSSRIVEVGGFLRQDDRILNLVNSENPPYEKHAKRKGDPTTRDIAHASMTNESHERTGKGEGERRHRCDIV